MKWFHLFAFFILSGLNSWSQEKVFEFDFSDIYMPKVIAGTLEKTESAVYLHTLLLNERVLKHVYVSQAGGKKEITVHTSDANENDSISAEANADHNIIFLYKKSDYLVHLPGVSSLKDVLYRKNSGKYYFITTQLPGGNPSVTDVVKIPEDSELIGQYASNDTIILVHHKFDKDEFIITMKKGDDPIKTDRVKIDFPGNEKSHKIGNFTLLTDSRDACTLLPSNLWMPPYVLDHYSFCFDEDNYLKFLVTEKDLVSWLVTLHLPSASYEIKRFGMPGLTGREKRKDISLWLTDSLFITGYSTSSALVLSFYNMSSTLIKTISITKDNFGNFTKSPIIKTGDFWSRSNTRESDFSEFLKKCNNNRLLITGYQDKENIFLTLATKYDLGPTATFLGNVTTLGLMDFHQVKPPSTLTFDIGLKLIDMKPNDREVRKLLWEKMLHFIWSVYTKSSSLYVRLIRDYLYVLYVNLDSKKIIVHRFNKFL